MRASALWRGLRVGDARLHRLQSRTLQISSNRRVTAQSGEQPCSHTQRQSQTTTIVNGIRLALSERGGKAGAYAVAYEDWDDASAKKGDWDPEMEAVNAERAIDDAQVIIYIGPHNSGAMVAQGLQSKMMMPDGCFEDAMVAAAGRDNADGRVYSTFGGVPPAKCAVLAQVPRSCTTFSTSIARCACFRLWACKTSTANSRQLGLRRPAPLRNCACACDAA